MTYSWTIPERSGPGPSDPNCITYAYYSSVSLVEVTINCFYAMVILHEHVIKLTLIE